jgi:hypothetical protein
MKFSLRNLMTFAASVAIALALLRLARAMEKSGLEAAAIYMLPACGAVLGAGIGALLQCLWRGAIIGFASIATALGALFAIDRLP